MKEDVKLSSNKHCLDLIGQRFERLFVLERVEDEVDKKSGKHKTRWLCQCDCGNKKIIRGASLTSGRIKSCGCLHKETCKKLGESKKGICVKILMNGNVVLKNTCIFATIIKNQIQVYHFFFVLFGK